VWVCVCQGQVRVGSIVSEGLYIKYSSCMLCPSQAGVGDLGHCVIKQMTFLTGSKEQPCFHRFLLMPSTEDPFELTHK